MFLISCAGTFVFINDMPNVSIIYYPSDCADISYYIGRYTKSTLNAIIESSIIKDIE